MSKEMGIICGTLKMDSRGLTHIMDGEEIPVARYTEEGTVNFTRFATRIIGIGKKSEDGKQAVVAEYISPLAEMYGIIDAATVIDERFTEQESLLEHIKHVLKNRNRIKTTEKK
ncbi:hypothetical protein SAMN04487767_101518 [Bacillus wiedmannii]|uniref:Tail spike domain-containing protein n=1 Tax=Bacillus wiedmannii TaxID=1890302 RepID=A0A1G6JUK3_9BACI|nr:phage tail protein [Bacillus wiedmannii]SDC22422.1 hypothetical protein SAMN04487767_101518 [Bacillus wiedmannii]